METRQIISTTAETLLRSAGTDGFSFADLAQAADIRKASVHYHFPTKADLTASVLRDYTARFWDALDDVPAAAPPAQKLQALVALYRDAMEDGSKLCLCVALSVTPHSLDPSITDAVRDFHNRLADWITDALGATDTAPALALLANLQGAQLVGRSFAGTATFDTIAAQALAQALNHSPMDGDSHEPEF